VQQSTSFYAVAVAKPGIGDRGRQGRFFIQGADFRAAVESYPVSVIWSPPILPSYSISTTYTIEQEQVLRTGVSNSDCISVAGV